MTNSIQYYDENADTFLSRTINIDMSSSYALFLKDISMRGKVLDAGCGSGRDALYFKKLGYNVLAFDASKEMVRISSQLLQEPTLQLCFQDLDFDETFDGVWASASLLHVLYQEMGDVIKKIHQALKPQGVFYASFKYGDHQREVEGRAFYDMNEETIQLYTKSLFQTLNIWAEEDTRSQLAPSPMGKWLNFLGVKI